MSIMSIPREGLTASCNLYSSMVLTHHCDPVSAGLQRGAARKLELKVALSKGAERNTSSSAETGKRQRKAAHCSDRIRSAPDESF